MAISNYFNWRKISSYLGEKLSPLYTFIGYGVFEYNFLFSLFVITFSHLHI